MIKNIALAICLATLLASNYAWYSSSQSRILDEHTIGNFNLEIRQRDIVIEELSSVIVHQNSSIGIDEMVNILKDHPKTKVYPPFYEVHEDLIEFGTTLKFEFISGKLTKVYW